MMRFLTAPSLIQTVSGDSGSLLIVELFSLLFESLLMMSRAEMVCRHSVLWTSQILAFCLPPFVVLFTDHLFCLTKFLDFLVALSSCYSKLISKTDRLCWPSADQKMIRKKEEGFEGLLLSLTKVDFLLDGKRLALTSLASAVTAWKSLGSFHSATCSSQVAVRNHARSVLLV